MRPELCVCSAIPRLKASTHLVLLIHKRELMATTNTGKLATYAFPSAEIRVRGKHNEIMTTEGMVAPGTQPLLLYPSEDAAELSHDYVKSLKGPFTLIVPDGTWRQAAKVAKREPGLAHIPRIKLPQGAPSEYSLRQAPGQHCLSTIEAIARTMGFLEGKEIQDELETLFRLVVTRTLWTRGMIPLAKCRDQIPDAALEALRLRSFQSL